MTALARRSAPIVEPHLWFVLAAALVVLGCLGALGAALWGDRPKAPERPATMRTFIPPRPDDVATLLNNTPLALARADALAVNAARKLDAVALTAARPFVLPAALAASGASGSALRCLTQAIYYAAASEGDAGLRAVAQVVLNRVRSPLFPNTVCGVVFQGSHLPTGCQFSFTCDGSLRRLPSAAGWARAQRVATAALAGQVERSVGLATHYHADYVVPYWASSLDKVATLGAHIFYNMRGRLGRPGSFGAAYDAAAEAAPTIELDETHIDALVAGSSGATGGIPAPRDRTVVAEDAISGPIAAAPPLGRTAGTLKADAAGGRLIVDLAAEAGTGAP